MATAAVVGVAVMLLGLVACSGPGNQNVPPQAPTDVSANPIPGGVRVVWVDQSTNEAEFIVFRSTADGEDEALAELARVPTDGAKYEDLAVDLGSAYTYAVAATNQFGTSDLVHQQPADPVSPGVGVRLTVTLDGAGTVDVLNGGQTVTCTSRCVVGLAQGTSVTLTAEGAEGLVFAGWAGACSMAGACTFTIEGDSDVEARFTKVALHLISTGDSPVNVNIGVDDQFGNRICVVEPGRTCAFGFNASGAFQVGAISTPVEAQAQLIGYVGACATPSTYCLIDVAGKTSVGIEVVRKPVAEAKSYQGREDTVLSVGAGDGLLVGVVDTPGDSHQPFVVSVPATGSLDVASDGSFEYQPAEHANGQVTFEFAVRDAHGNESATRTATLDLAAVNDAPRFDLAGDPPGTPGQGQLVTVPDFATGLHPSGGPDEAGQSLDFIITAPAGPPGQAVASNVALAINPGGSTATLTYTAKAGAVGTSTYQVALKDDGGIANDGADTSETRSFTITVSPVQLTLTATTGGSLDPVTGVHDYPYGVAVNVTATAAAGYSFMGWTGACTNAINPCQVSMTGNRSLNATFWPVVRVQPSGGGLFFVTSSPAGISGCSVFDDPSSTNCRSAFAPGSEVTLSVGEVARTFTGVTCAGGNFATSCKFTVTGPVTIGVS